MNGPIVVGTDGSTTAAVAVAAAIDLAKTFDQSLHVVSAYHPDKLPTGLPGEFDGCIRSTSAVESVLADAVARATASGVSATGHSATGSASDAVLSVAEKVGAHVIVVGNRGIGSKARRVLGNVPSRIVHHATCSTFIVETS